MQRSAPDQSDSQQPFSSTVRLSARRVIHFVARSDSPTACVTNRSPRSLSGASSHAGTRTIAGMSRQVDSIGDDRCRRVSCGRAIRENRHRIGDAQGKTAPAPSAGRNSAHRICRVKIVVPNSDGRSGRSTIPTTNFSPSLKMQRDVSTIVHVSARKLRRRSIAARISSATAPATAAMGVMKYSLAYGITAAIIRRATLPRRPLRLRRSRRFRRNASSPHNSSRIVTNLSHAASIRRLDLARRAKRLHDQVDRTIAEMKPPAIGQHPHLCALIHLTSRLRRRTRAATDCPCAKQPCAGPRRRHNRTQAAARSPCTHPSAA